MFDAKTMAILKIRAKLLYAARYWLNQNDYVEVHGPTIIPAVGDWPGSFEVKYFDKKAYLTQGLQPYANAFMTNLGKIYTIAPAFRAEKVRTRRHLTEYWRIEAAQQCEFDTIIGVQEEIIVHICHNLSAEAADTLRCFNRSVKNLANIKTPFPRITYDEAIDTLQRDGFKISWGQKLEREMEKQLSLKFNQPFFITKFPIGVETFFYKSDPENPELTLSVDLLAPEGYGEISSGLQMITEKEVISKKMTDENIDREDQLWYLSFMQYDSIPYSGFAIGLERLIQWVCKLAHVKEATAFPRLYDCCFP
ncbi:asparagine--tRNA ligase [Candidatus Bathyarchaeota archaeon]|nr:asparagine--tRNA ligase [Candidatus Bathyarchaeota archaeon]